ncbi:hypothetical protein GUJ93_ZPchr0007g3559 [Zizania palustris]|uniref:Uncharacterized protein n=1 Tax=Zizania palustris TaxID=103762 RepID=A0A8J5VZ78_ZIZPA|nr:hypothetical protein GUJ93_ZPchr0007g3559 [Zizania palustris]
MDGDGDNDGRADVLVASAEAEISGAVVPSGRRRSPQRPPRQPPRPHPPLPPPPPLPREPRRLCRSRAHLRPLPTLARPLGSRSPYLSSTASTPTACARVHAALAARARAVAAPDITRLHVYYFSRDLLPPTASWLSLAPPILSGLLVIQDWQASMAANELPAGIIETRTFELLCFKKAIKISLHLEFLTLLLPPSGAFNALTALHLKRIRIDGN